MYLFLAETYWGWQLRSWAQNTIIFPHVWQMHQETTAKNSRRGVCRTARGQPFPYYLHLTFWWRKAPFRGFLIHHSGVAVSLLGLHPASNVAQQGEHLGTMVRGMQGCNGSWKAERAARAGGNAVTATARCNPSHYLEPGEQVKQIWSTPRVNVTYLSHRNSKEGRGFISNTTVGRRTHLQHKREVQFALNW